MKKIHCLNAISTYGTALLTEEYELTNQMEGADGVLVRSASMHEMALPDGLLAIARAGAGVNNIPLEACAAEGIVVFNTPGANANGVKELVIAGLMLASRDIEGGIRWCKENQEDENISKSAEKPKVHLPDVKSEARSLVSLVLAPSVQRLPMPALPLEWMCTDTTPSSQLTLPGDFQEM